MNVEYMVFPYFYIVLNMSKYLFETSKTFTDRNYPEDEDNDEELNYIGKTHHKNDDDEFYDNNDLISIVGSKNRRHIYRIGNFRNPYAFDEWQNEIKKKNPKDPRLKLVGELKNVDEDPTPEFLVKRGKRLIAVNGYSTKKSDYPIEYEYYSKHPTESERKATPMDNWLFEKYKDKMNIDEKTGLPSDEYYTWRNREIRNRKDNPRIPSMTASNIFKRAFVFDIYHGLLEQGLNKIYKTLRIDESDRRRRAEIRSAIIAKCVKIEGDKRWLTILAKDLYDNYVKIPIFKKIMSMDKHVDKKGNVYKPSVKYEEDFLETNACKNAATDEQRTREFIKYVMGKPLAKDLIAQKVAKVLSKDREIASAIIDHSKEVIGTTVLTACESFNPKSERPPSRGGMNLGAQFEAPAPTKKGRKQKE